MILVFSRHMAWQNSNSVILSIGAKKVGYREHFAIFNKYLADFVK